MIFGFVLFALRSAPSERFCLTGLSMYIGNSSFSYIVLQVYLYFGAV